MTASRWFALVVVALLAPSSVHAANYPLELVSPRTAGSSPSSGLPAISATNRIFWAYPGIEYNIRATVIGGAYPYTFALTGAPSGMTIDSQTGEIRWPNPTANASPTIVVKDSENQTVSSSWTITVDPGRFIFLDAVNGREFDAPKPGTGTMANPFRRIRDLYGGDGYGAKRDNRHVNKIAYFKTGTYFIDGFIEDTSGANAGRMALLDTAKPVAWVAFPGQTPVIDGQCAALSPQIGSRPCNYGRHIAFYGGGHNTYIDGFRLINMAVHAFRVAGTGNYQTFRRNRFSINGPAPAGVNQGFITTIVGGPGESGYFMTIQDNVFEDIEQGVCVKLYSTSRITIEDNVCRDVRGRESEGFAAKGGDMDRVTIRHNVVSNVYQRGIGGNMHILKSGEILFNRVSGATNSALEINQDGLAGPIYIERNTVVGLVVVRDTDSSDGPFYFRNNVIINTERDKHIMMMNVTDPSRVVMSNNLVGSPSQKILDDDLNLTPGYAKYLGTHGHQTAGGSAGRGAARVEPESEREPPTWGPDERRPGGAVHDGLPAREAVLLHSAASCGRRARPVPPRGRETGDPGVRRAPLKGRPFRTD